MGTCAATSPPARSRDWFSKTQNDCSHPAPLNIDWLSEGTNHHENRINIDLAERICANAVPHRLQSGAPSDIAFLHAVAHIAAAVSVLSCRTTPGLRKPE